MMYQPIILSLQTATTTTLLAFVFGMLLARWRITARPGWGIFIDALMILPVALPPTVVGLSLLLILGPHSPVADVVQLLFTWPATVIAAFAVSFPLMYLSCRAAIEQLDPALIDLARTYGYSEWRILWRVMLPLGWPGIAVGVLLTFVRALGEFGATLMAAGNLPGKTQTLPLAIFFAVERGDLTGALALSAVSVVLSLLAIGILGWLRRSRS